MLKLFLILLAITAFFAFGIGTLVERHGAAKKQRKLERRRLREQAKIERQELWRKRKEAVIGKMIPWRRGRQGN
jgi:hypothetical protein